MFLGVANGSMTKTQSANAAAPNPSKKSLTSASPTQRPATANNLPVARSEASGQVEHKPDAEQDDADEEMRPQRAERSNRVL